MFREMGYLSSESRDNLIEEGGMHEKMVYRIIKDLQYMWREERPSENMINFLWEAFEFSLLLSLWWVSKKGKRIISNELKLLRRQAVRVRNENINTVGIAKEFTETLRQVITQETQQIRNTYHNEGQEIHIVRNAIEQFIPEYTNLRIKRIPRPHMLIDKKDETYDLDQLSDGEKNLIALIGDIARRLTLGNPRINNPLEGDGIILIDEIDLHLHPSWQRLVIPKLLEVFPNCQFFISTHSPQVLSHVKPKNIFLLEQDKEGLTYRNADETYGMSLDRVVELVMGDESRPKIVSNNLDKLFELIERNKLNEAKKLIKELIEDMRTDPEIMRAEMLIRKKEMNK